MDTATALRTRHSTRAFLARPIPDDVIAGIVDDAREAPSWSNTQPYRLAIASGDLCNALRHDFMTAAKTQMPNPDLQQLFTYPPTLQARRRATGFGLYDTLGIDKADAEGRARQFERNHAMFDAPTAMFIFAHKALQEYAVFDAGCFLMALLLGATARGVQSCAQAVLASYPDLVRARFDIDDDHVLLCGVAMGYADEHNPVNRFRPARLAAADLLVPPKATP